MTGFLTPIHTNFGKVSKSDKTGEFVNRFVVVLASALLALTSSVGLASSATAAASDCPSTSLCFFQDINYSGDIYLDTGTQGSWHYVYWFNDQMSSWINNSAYDARWSVDASGGGATYCMNSASQNAQVISSRNDLLSAYFIYFSNAIC